MIDGKHTTLDWQMHPGDICILPVGSFEQHSGHLPLATDTLQAEHFARIIAEDLDAALLPVLGFGTALEHSGFRGTFSLKPETLMQIVRDLADEAQRQQFKILIVVNGHGGNFWLNPAIRDFNRRDHPLKILLVEPYQFWPADVVESRKLGTDAHAGESETSVMLALWPDLVRPERRDQPAAPAGGPPLGLPDLNTFGIGQIAPDGAAGYPSFASRAKGETMLAAMRARLLPHVRDRIQRLRRQWRYVGAGGIAVRPMVETDLEAGLRLKTLAGWNQTEADWRLFLETNPAGCFVAVQNGKVIGCVATIRYGKTLAWLSMMLVDPEYRRMGIGHRLMEQAMGHLQDCPTVKLDATPQGMELYRSFGFVDEYPLQRWTHAGSPSLAESSAPGVSPVTEAEMEAVIVLDQQVLGAGRAAILRSLVERAPETARCIKRRGTVAGFVLGRPGVNFHQIGPVVAESAVDAILLASAALNANAGRPVTLDVPEAQSEFRRWLVQRGFVAQRPLLRMVHGANRAAGKPAQLFAAAGPEFG